MPACEHIHMQGKKVIPHHYIAGICIVQHGVATEAFLRYNFPYNDGGSSYERSLAESGPTYVPKKDV